jgi:hypothetical protein
MEGPISERTNLLTTLLYLIESDGPILVRYPYVTDARRLAAQLSGIKSWRDAAYKFNFCPVSIASYQAPLVKDLDSLRASVTSVGAAFYQGSLYGPVDVLDLLWDNYTSCELPVSDFAARVDRYPPHVNVLKVTSSFKRCPAVLVGEDEALFPKSVLIPFLRCHEIGLYAEKEPTISVNDLTVSVPLLDPDASVADAARLVRRFGVAALPDGMVVTATEILKAPLAARLDHHFVRRP